MDPLGLGTAGGKWGVPVKSKQMNAPSNQAGRSVPPGTNFSFEKPNLPIDWHKVSQAPIKMIERRGDARMLQQYLPFIALGDVTNTMEDVAHPSLIKAFQHGQLATQYLLSCQVKLEEQTNLMNADMERLEKAGRRMAEKESRMDKKVKELRREEREMKKLINTYHRMLRKHNPDLATRVVGHGDGRISLLEKGNEFTGGGLETGTENDTDFYEGYVVGKGGKKEKGKHNVVFVDRVSYEEVFGEEEGVGEKGKGKGKEKEKGGNELTVKVEVDRVQTPERKQRGEKGGGKEEEEGEDEEYGKGLTNSPEARRIRESIESTFGDETKPQLSPAQRANPVLEAMKKEGLFDDLSYSDGDEEEEEEGGGMGRKDMEDVKRTL
ncbi:hypothetical protein TrCOL_g12243 [Triparma columacea]|uniref:Cilium assembly protein DZIP1 N-terminal domain-containing protein n=1 Tax=Triparma columacea TaxID=722753 RepID=A0A9W7G1R9_9STRA|nr:hypothetical protein TrCOL_g12243 [Triparma columacea]